MFFCFVVVVFFSSKGACFTAPTTLHQIRKFADSFSFPDTLHSGDSMVGILMSTSQGVH